MKKYALIITSTTDIPADMAKELDLEVVPLTFTVNDKQYKNFLDNREMASKDFYDAIRNGAMPSTSQVNSEEFINVMKPHLEKGNDVILLSFSSGLSGTYNSARLAAEELKEQFPNNEVIAIDTKAASMGEGMIAYLAGLKRKDGASITELRDYVMDLIPKQAHWFTVTDISHLKRGGRISGVASVVANILSIKPILHVDDEGKLVPVLKAMGQKKAIRALVDQMKKTVTNTDVVFISHGDYLEGANMLMELIKTEFDVKKFVVNPIGPVIGSHAGPGTIALFYIGTGRN